MELPVVFIHRGYSAYLEFSLRQAKAACPGSEIILLGDASNDRFDFVTHAHAADFFESASRFAGLYRHISTNSREYELFCFQRWFVLEDFLRGSGRAGPVFVCDSDVMLYSDLAALRATRFKDCEVGLSSLNDLSYSAATSYWTLDALSSLNRFMEGFYGDEAKLSETEALWKSRWAEGRLGGYCDMSVIADFRRAFPSMKLSNLVDVFDGAAFDDQVNSPEGYKRTFAFKRGAKAFVWRGGVPYCRDAESGEDVRFLCVHCQGPAKYMMASLYTGPDFPGRRKLVFKFAFLNFLAYWYKTLKLRSRFAFLFNLLAKLKG